jgi:hypothetical protein
MKEGIKTMMRTKIEYYPLIKSIYGDGGSIVGKICTKGNQLLEVFKFRACSNTPPKSLDTNKEMGDLTPKAVKYSKMLEPENYKRAYMNLKSKPGNGVDDETLDGFSNKTIDAIIAQMKDRTYKFKPSKRIYIPKANGKIRPLGIPSPKDKIVQEVFREALEEIVEKEFLDTSHGFRPKRSCQTAI